MSLMTLGGKINAYTHYFCNLNAQSVKQKNFLFHQPQFSGWHDTVKILTIEIGDVTDIFAVSKKSSVYECS